MSKILDEFSRAFGAVAQVPEQINATSEEIRETVQDVKAGAGIFLLLQVSMTISSGIMAYVALRNLTLKERQRK